MAATEKVASKKCMFCKNFFLTTFTNPVLIGKFQAIFSQLLQPFKGYFKDQSCFNSKI